MNIRTRVSSTALIIALAASMQGCVIIPLPTKKLVSNERLEQLVIGATTRDEVYATFGDRYWRDPGGSGVVYSKDRSVAFVATAWGAGMFEDAENLYLEFDDRDVLTHFEQFEFDEGRACVDSGVCMIGDVRGGSKTLTIVAFSRPPEEDLQAKQFVRSPDVCSVYLYGDASLNSTYQVSGALHRVCLDEQSMTALYSPDMYLHMQLSPGTHQLAVGNAYAWNYTNGLVFNRDDEDLLTAKRTLHCEPGAVHFLRIEESAALKGLFLTKYESSGIALEAVDEQTGKAAVAGRILASDALGVGPVPHADSPDRERDAAVCSSTIRETG